MEDGLTEKLKADWNKANLLNKGALMDDYSLIDDGKWIEGEWDITARSAKSRRTWTRSFTSTSSRSPMTIEVQDNGKHNLKHYQRVIITVK